MYRQTRFGITAGSVAIVCAVLAAPVMAAESGDVLVASAGVHRTLVLGDVAADDAIGVVYEKSVGSFMKWSTDGGQTFSSAQALRGGAKASHPRLAACGSRFWAVSEWPTDYETIIGVDYRDVTSGVGDRFALYVGGFRPDIACFGDVAAAVWLTEDGSAMFKLIDLECPGGCGRVYTHNLGVVDSSSEGPRIAAVDDGFVVTWVEWGLAVQHVRVERGTYAYDVSTDSPLVKLMFGKYVYSPVIAGDGARVAIAYGRRGQTHMRISEDRGATFGERSVVSRYCLNCSGGGSSPYSIDARDGRILVEVLKGFGDPPGFETVGKITRGGSNWRTISSRGGAQMGVLDGTVADEVRDSHFYADRVYGDVPQEILFHATPLE